MNARVALLCSLALPFSVLLVVPARTTSVAHAPPARVARLARTAPAAAEDDLVDKVRKAIEDGKTFLKNKQSAEGHWEVAAPGLVLRGGTTSLVVLALLQSGVPVTDEKVQKGLAYLARIESNATYVVSLQTMAFILAGTHRERVERNVQWLLKARGADGWGYGSAVGERAGAYDNSNSQYALLALHEAIQAGYKVPRPALEAVQKLYMDTQIDGGWGYTPRRDKRATITMTTAGLCNLLISGLDLNIGKAKLRPDGSAVDCGKYDENEKVAKAIDWLGRAFPAEITPANAGTRFDSPFYALYGIERAGRLTGQRYFGGHDWYEVGCRYLVSIQKADGSWQGGGGAGRQLDRHQIVATSFALLFLSKGRTPVLISKLAYGNADYTGWNNKRNDMKHLVEFARAVFPGKPPLAWQAFDVRNFDLKPANRKQIVQELLQSPIVYFNGHDYAPRGEYRDILKEYVANGGFIMVENCCGKARHPSFDRDLREFVEKGLEADLEKLEPEHPVWTASGKFSSSWRDYPLEGVQQGCRTVLIYSPVPLAGYWEANLYNDGDKGQKAFRMGANIIAYATGLEPPRPRLTQVVIASEEKAPRLKRGFMKVAQLKHIGTWHPAPKAMFNLMAEARKAGLDVVLTKAELRVSSELVHDHRFLYMHGRSNFTEARDGLKDLRFCLKNGGLLFADACCGAPAFDASFRKFMQVLWADDKLKLEPIPLSDELFGAELNGEQIRTVRCRRRGADGKPMRGYPDMAPQLEGIKYKDRWVVIYSKYDIGCALERQKSPDCLGHDYESAVKLGRAAVLYALKR